MEQIILQGTTVDEFLTKLRDIVASTIEEKRQQPEHAPHYLTRKETAERLNISLPTLNEHSKKGLIPSYRFGTRILYKEEDIEQALKEVIPTRAIKK